MAMKPPTKQKNNPIPTITTSKTFLPKFEVVVAVGVIGSWFITG
ncbi:hypothetical protein [Nostoc sp. NMS7]|nr:hypothetical protein [Nostoc sp. NMS7]